MTRDAVRAAIREAAVDTRFVDPTAVRDLVVWHYLTSKKLGLMISYDEFCAVVKDL